MKSLMIVVLASLTLAACEGSPQSLTGPHTGYGESCNTHDSMFMVHDRYHPFTMCSEMAVDE